MDKQDAKPEKYQKFFTLNYEVILQIRFFLYSVLTVVGAKCAAMPPFILCGRVSRGALVRYPIDTI